MELNKEKYLALKGSRKIVANALLEESEKFLFLDIEEIAAELGTTPSTLSRIVRAIGFDSFKGFRTWIARKSGLMIPAGEVEADVDDGLLYDELKGVEAIFSGDVIEKIDKAAHLIARKGAVIVAGFGLEITGILVDLLENYFRWIGIRCCAARNSKYDAIASYHTFGENCVLFLIDLDKPFREALETLRVFKDRGVPRVSLTAVPLSRIGMMSSLVIPLRVERRFCIPPTAPFAAVIDLLVMKVANLRSKEMKGKMKLLEKIRNDKELISPHA
ncbi:MAG: MurR/RpiR family transcriptional regulator [Candidatus Aminicenantes bacterium]|nr:MurR/RpiR family transcriptional regulator [Candidatus Aminicenantes bacterium]